MGCTEIAAAIEANLTPWERPACVTDHPLVSNPMSEMMPQYLAAVEALRRRERTANAAAPPLVYTPLHGVGLPLLRRAFDAFGLPTPLVVDAQVRRRLHAPSFVPHTQGALLSEVAQHLWACS